MIGMGRSAIPRIQYREGIGEKKNGPRNIKMTGDKSDRTEIGWYENEWITSNKVDE